MADDEHVGFGVRFAKRRFCIANVQSDTDVKRVRPYRNPFAGEIKSDDRSL